MTAFTGRDTLIEFAIAKEDASVGSLTWQTLGMMRKKSMKTSWETVDTTADKSPAFTKTTLVTFKAVEFSGEEQVGQLALAVGGPRRVAPVVEVEVVHVHRAHPVGTAGDRHHASVP